MYERFIVNTLRVRVGEKRHHIQMLIGPRQTGKTTALRQLLSHVEIPAHSAATSIDTSSRDWLRAQWHVARTMAAASPEKCALLVIDEIQLIDQWSAVVKELWDEDAWNDVDLRVVLSGSSSLLLQHGLAESLTGRFELIRCPHWSLSECEAAFGYGLDDYLMYGGYPGSAQFKDDDARWLDYMVDSVIEPSISKDVIALESIHKPALMRRLFYFGAPYSAQELSYRKMLGQLDDAGNTTTIAHYLDLLGDAGLLCALSKYDPKLLRKRTSSPRLLVYDPSLMTATYGAYRPFLITDPERKGHLVETAVGANLLRRAKQEHFELFWWRDGNDEVDFVASQGDEVIAIEVKSGRVKSTRGLTAFINRYPTARPLIIGSHDHLLEDFLASDKPLFELAR